MGHNSVVSGHLKSTGLPRVDELSTGPPDLGRHKRSKRPEAYPKFLEDFIHSIRLYLLDGLPKPHCEVSNRLLFLLENCL